MAAITVTWNPSAPAGSDILSAGDDEIRNFKSGLTERLRNGGHQWQTAGATTDATDGRHCCGESNAAGSAELAGEFNIYAADTTTVIATVRDTTAAGIIGGIAELYMGANRIRTTGDLRAATATITGAVTLSSTVAVIGVPTFTASLAAAVTNTVDIGSTGVRFKDLWLAGNATLAGNLSVGGTATMTGVVTFTAQPVFNGGVSFSTGTYTGLLTLSGGLKTTINPQTGNYTVVTTDSLVMFTLTGSVVVTLPLASTMPGQHVWLQFKATSGTNTVTLRRSGSDTINGGTGDYAGANTVTASRRVAIHVISDGTSDWVIANNVAIT